MVTLADGRAGDVGSHGSSRIAGTELSDLGTERYEGAQLVVAATKSPTTASRSTRGAKLGDPAFRSRASLDAVREW